MNKKSLFVWMIILTALAGAINAIAIFGYDGMTVSHVTGLVSKFSTSIALGDFKGSLDFLALILSFLLGAILAGIVTGERAFYLHKRYGFIIIIIGALFISAYFLDVRHSVLLFAFLMALQNGMVVSFRGVLVRMTHMSGNLTDLGVFIGYRIRGNKNEKLITGIVPLIAILSFITGGIAGILLYNWINKYVFIVVSLIYIVLGFIYFYLQKICKDKDFDDINDDEE